MRTSPDVLQKTLIAVRVANKKASCDEGSSISDIVQYASHVGLRVIKEADLNTLFQKQDINRHYKNGDIHYKIPHKKA